MTIRRQLFSSILTVAFAAGLCAQAPTAQTPTAPAPTAGPVRSPEVTADRHITFRLQAPRATSVSLSFDEGAVQTFPMTKDAQGLWTVTIGPVAPEIYIYNFVVDGLRVLDLQNTNLKSGTALASNVVEVPGTPARFDQVQDVPHGAMVVHSYRSTVQNAERGLYVYVPADYYTSTTKRYPVLYLYHGGGGMEADWSRDGRAGVILDNLIAGGRAVPMIVVMPNNNLVAPATAGRAAGAAQAAPQTAGRAAGATPAAPQAPAPGPPASAATLGRELLTDIVPFIERHYRVQADRDHRAIAGLSAGGGTAFPVGLNNLATFATVGEFSSGMFGGTGAVAPGTTPVAVSPDVIVPGLYKNAATMSKQLKLLYMSVGTEDPRLPFQRQTVDALKEHGFSPVFMTFAGAHQWKVWRYSLHDFAPRLFR